MPSLPRRTASLAAALAAAALLASRALPGTEPPAAPPGDGSRGRAVYESQCAACHGEKGRGDGPAAWLLNPRPRDFSLAKLKFPAASNGAPAEADVLRTLENGLPGAAMPSFSHLPEPDRRAAAGHVMGLMREGLVERLVEKKVPRERAAAAAADRLRADPPFAPPPEPAPTPEGWSNGRRVFLAACVSCHGPEGHGDGPSASTLVDDAGFPISPRDLTRGVFKGGADAASIFQRVRLGIPGTPMPAHPALTDAETWDVVHHVKSLSGPGAQERATLRAREMIIRRSQGPLPAAPEDPAWAKVQPTYLALMALWSAPGRYGPGGVTVRALHDGSRVAVHLSWVDATEDRDVDNGGTFPDGAAIQWSAAEIPPFLGMGSRDSSVAICLWKAAYGRPSGEAPVSPEQEAANTAVEKVYGDGLGHTGRAAGNPLSVSPAKAGAEDLRAVRFGSLTSGGIGGGGILGAGRWKDAAWEVVMARPAAAEGAPSFEPGRPVWAAFAVWDGSRGDRDGQKSVTVWHRMILEK